MRLTSDTSSLPDPSRYYVDGFVTLPVSSQDKLLSLLIGLQLGEKTREGYFWDTVLNSHSLRPHVYEYDSSVLDFLFENDLPKKLEIHTEKRLTLSHIQIIKTDPGRSYQDWHRDTYQIMENPWVGNTPPAHKIIYYPSGPRGAEPRLKFIRGTNRCMVNNPQFDANLISSIENEVIYSDNNNVLLFDTSILHGVIPDETPDGSIRLIYNFISERQYREKYESKNHHKVLHDMYEERMKL